ncbi:unnamed protein product [Timema podura]|uniref:Uncharacterized protein n=1 Tax=Timema podura TaxID=61482 RepID=A0ABN7NIL7_TIMPD|nr:unnamed protein product [Timema podura]
MEKTVSSLFKPWYIWMFLCLLLSALGAGLGVPLALSFMGPSNHQQRLQVVRRLLRDVPLVDGWGEGERLDDDQWNCSRYIRLLRRLIGPFYSNILEKGGLYVKEPGKTPHRDAYLVEKIVRCARGRVYV